MKLTKRFKEKHKLLGEEKKKAKDMTISLILAFMLFSSGWLWHGLYVGTKIHYVRAIDYHGAKLKFYDSSLVEECTSILDAIPHQYFYDLGSIQFYRHEQIHKKRILGEYGYFTRNLYIYVGCDIDTIIHELAHHCQKMRGDSFWLGMRHTGEFKSCYDEIYSEFNYTQDYIIRKGIFYD